MDEALFSLARSAAILAGLAAVGYGLYRAVFALLRSEMIGRHTPVLQACLGRCATPARMFLPLLGVYMGLPFALPADWLAGARHGLSILLIAVAAWLLLRALHAVDDAVSARLGIEKVDNLDARRIQTQLRVIRAVFATVIITGAGIAILFTFPQLRQLGAGILASASVAGIIAGLAAQRLLANLFAGFQVGFTQPIRLDDVVVVEGEWGRIEEITLTYVVVSIWDQRRLVLPISYFLEKPFTNWTRQTAELLGTVFFYVDYRAPINEIRQELQRIVEKSALWDKRVCRLQVTDAKEQTVEIRALVSARDSSDAFELRCQVREQLLEFLQKHHPGSLPRLRAELSRRAIDSA